MFSGKALKKDFGEKKGLQKEVLFLIHASVVNAVYFGKNRVFYNHRVVIKTARHKG